MGRPGGPGGRGRGRGRGRGSLGPRGGGVAKKRSGDAERGGDHDSNKHRSVKNKIRGVERLLKREGIDPRVRAAKEAELAELQVIMAQHLQQELERKYAVKYHRIKFFERVKLERAIKKLERRMLGAGESKSSEDDGDGDEDGEGDKDNQPLDPELAKVKLAAFKEDLMYVKYFPKGEKYVSILRDAEDSTAQKHLEAERERLRAIVRRQVAEVAAVTEADEGRALLGDKALAAAQPSKEVASGKAKGNMKAYPVGDSTAETKPGGNKPKQKAKQAAAAAAAASSKKTDTEEVKVEAREALLKAESVEEEEEEDGDDFFLAADQGGGGASSSDHQSEDELGLEYSDEYDNEDGAGEAEDEDDEDGIQRGPGGGMTRLAAKVGVSAAAATKAAAAPLGAVPPGKRGRVEGPAPHLREQLDAKLPRHAFAVKQKGNNGEKEEDEDDFFLPADEDDNVAAAAAVAAAAGASRGGVRDDLAEVAGKAQPGKANGVRQPYKPPTKRPPGSSRLGGDGNDDECIDDDHDGSDDDDGEDDAEGSDDEDPEEGDGEEEGPPQWQLSQGRAGRGGSARRPHGLDGRQHSGRRGDAVRGRGGPGGAGGFRGRGRSRGEGAGERGGHFGTTGGDQGRRGPDSRGGGDTAAERKGEREGSRGSRGGRYGGREGPRRNGTPPRNDTLPIRTRADGGRKRRKKGGGGGKE